MNEREHTERFFSTGRFFDPDSNFLLDCSGAAGFDYAAALTRHRRRVKAALDFVRAVEAGRIVNVSEKRRVDHFNLRKGPGLLKSLRLWRRIRRDVEAIRSGTKTAPSGKPYADVIMNGIGGSFLGPLMLLIAEHGVDYNSGGRLPLTMHFVSNTDPESFFRIIDGLDLSRTIMVNISKSGGTAETAGNMEAFNELLRKQGLNPGRHNIAVTTPGSPFDDFARRKRFLHIYHMNNETGGRTSVGSAVGMVPAAFGGIDFEAFLRGQSHMDRLTRRRDPWSNPALRIALLIHDALERLGRTNQILLGYADATKEVAHYFQQLFMESLGKDRNRADTRNIPPTGLTIFGGVGTGEQHAFMQQVQKGVRDAFVHFVHFRKRSRDIENTRAGSMGRQLQAFVVGTQQALRKNGREYLSIQLERPDPFNLGMLVALEERVVALLGGMWNINPFDQPGVQDGKLSADGHNRLSAEVVQWLQTQRSFSGTALDICRVMGRRRVDAPAIELIMSDIDANIDLPGAYPDLDGLRVSRRWQNGGFTFRICET